MTLLIGAMGRRPELIFSMFVVWVCWKLVMQGLVMQQNSSVIEHGSEDGRAVLRRTIADLKAKLAS
jgi:hypothetical protein